MSRLLASMSPQQRAELQALAEQVMQDLDLAFEVDRLGSNLQGMFPGMGWGEPTLAGGEQPMPLSATVDAMERLHDYEDLDRSLEGDYAGAAVDDIDEDVVAPDARGGGRPRPAQAQADRTDARGGRARPARATGTSRSRREARGRWASARSSASSRSSGAIAKASTRRATAGGSPSPPARPGRGGSGTRGRSPSSGRSSTRCSGAAPARRSGSCPTTSSSWRRSSAPRPRPRCSSTCRSRCRSGGTSCTRRRWRSRCTR